MERTAIAAWNGKLKEGEGRLTTQSASLRDARFSFPTRFGGEPGTNPEELIAAAHAGCYTMAFAFFAESAGAVPRQIETRAALSFDLGAQGPVVTGVHLHLRADVAGLADAPFRQIAQRAKDNCLVSRLLNTTVTLTAQRWAESG